MAKIDKINELKFNVRNSDVRMLNVKSEEYLFFETGDISQVIQ